LPQLKEGAFMRAFGAKCRFAALLRAMPPSMSSLLRRPVGAVNYGLEHEAA